MLKQVRNKLSGRHRSLTTVAQEVVTLVGVLSKVTKIVPGIIRSTRSPAVAKSLKITEIPAGIRLRVRSPKSVQELFVYTPDFPAVKAALAALFPKT